MRYPTVIRLAALSILAAASAATAGAQAQASITVDATKAVRLVDERVFGMNTAVWDGAFGEPQTLVVLQQTDTRFLRYPGGSSSDQYHWQTNSDTAGNSAGSTNFDVFAKTAQAISAQVVITANYGTGTAQEAAAWVTYSNVTKGYGFKYWEIGNECYGTWEDDATAYPHDPYTYATRAVQYIKAMKAVDPTIKIGVPVVTGEDSNSNGYTSHTVTNPVTNVTHNGWTPVVLATMKSLGVLPDFVCYHRYEQNSGQENDSNLLQTALTWPNDAVNLRGMLNDYLSSSGASVEILCTENNSVNTNPGKQSVSIVDGLYMLDSIGNIMKTEINSLVWWALHNGQNTSGYNSSALYGWREYGDYGIEQGDSSATDSIAHDPYPTFFAMKLLKYFARQGDTVISASSSDPLLSVFAAHRLDDSLSLLIVNKNASVTFTTTISLNGYTPQATAKVYSYGVTQDSAAEAASAPPTQGSAAATLVSSWDVEAVPVTVESSLPAASKDSVFQYLAPPQITQIVPSSGVQDQETPVSVYGTNFNASTVIYLGQTLASAVPLAKVSLQTLTEIDGTVPASHGQATVWAFDITNGWTSLPNGFSWTAP